MIYKVIIYRINSQKHSELWSYNSWLDVMKCKQIWNLEKTFLLYLSRFPEKKVNFFQDYYKNI